MAAARSATEKAFHFCMSRISNDYCIRSIGGGFLNNGVYSQDMGAGCVEDWNTGILGNFALGGGYAVASDKEGAVSGLVDFIHIENVFPSK
jgi:hypothetical protein